MKPMTTGNIYLIGLYNSNGDILVKKKAINNVTKSNVDSTTKFIVIIKENPTQSMKMILLIGSMR